MIYNKYINYFNSLDNINLLFGNKIGKLKTFDKNFIVKVINSKSKNFEIDINSLSSIKSISIPKVNKNLNKPFISLLLCGGLSTRFGGKHKFGLKDKFNISLIGYNIKKLLKYEKSNNITIPLIIFCDYLTIKSIKSHLLYYNYFGKNKNDIYFINNYLGYRVDVNCEIINEFSLKKEYANLLNTTNTYNKFNATDSYDDYLAPEGHYIFNILYYSKLFKDIIVKYNLLDNYLVVSNCNNVGNKYFNNIINNSFKNIVIGTSGEENEKADLVVNINNKLNIIPYFLKGIEKAFSISNIVFTGTMYLNIKNLLNYFEENSDKNKKLIEKNKYYPILKHSKQGIKLHFESCLSDIVNNIDFDLYYINRNKSFIPIRNNNLFK